VFDLGYLGVEKDMPEQLYHHYLTERREVWKFHKKKKNTICSNMLKKRMVFNIPFVD